MVQKLFWEISLLKMGRYHRFGIGVDKRFHFKAVKCLKGSWFSHVVHDMKDL